MDEQELIKAIHDTLKIKQDEIDELVNMLERCEDALGKPPKQQYIQRMTKKLLVKYKGG